MSSSGDNKKDRGEGKEGEPAIRGVDEGEGEEKEKAVVEEGAIGDRGSGVGASEDAEEEDGDEFEAYEEGNDHRY